MPLIALIANNSSLVSGLTVSPPNPLTECLVGVLLGPPAPLRGAADDEVARFAGPAIVLPSSQHRCNISIKKFNTFTAQADDGPRTGFPVSCTEPVSRAILLPALAKMNLEASIIVVSAA